MCFNMKNYYENHFLFILCVFILKFFIVKSWDDLCYTSTWENGNCVPYSQCAYVYRLASNYGLQLPPHEKEKLLNSRCSNRTDAIYICCTPKDIIRDRHHLQIQNVDNTKVDQQQPSFVDENLPKNTADHISSTTVPLTLSSRFNEDDDGDDFTSNLNSRGLEILSSMRCGMIGGKRIAYGEEVKKGDFPWMALLEYNSTKNIFKCGGTLITDRYVLTAAHCILNDRQNLVGVVLGAHNVSEIFNCNKSDVDASCAERFGVEQVIKHPQFNPRRLTNDIALIRLDRVVQFTINIRPICLPISAESAQFQIKQRFIIAGWGLTEHGDNSSQVLLKATIPLRELNLCDEVLKQANYRSIRIGESHICAGGVDGTDACHGDSGGPLFFRAPYKSVHKFVQFGIVSFGFSICGTNIPRPGVYTNITHFMPWITENIY